MTPMILAVAAVGLAVIVWLICRPCSHEHTRRERRDGSYWLVCNCGHEVPAIGRDDDDAKRQLTLKRRIARSKKAMVVKPMPANVTPIDERRKAR